LHLGTVEKTLFSMATPEFLSVLKNRELKSLVVMGIEACLTPTRTSICHYRVDGSVV
jgi:hypothetical protein